MQPVTVADCMTCIRVHDQQQCIVPAQVLVFTGSPGLFFYGDPSDSMHLPVRRLEKQYGKLLVMIFRSF